MLGIARVGCRVIVLRIFDLDEYVPHASLTLRRRDGGDMEAELDRMTRSKGLIRER